MQVVLCADEETKRPYFHNHKSKESTWELPDGAVVAAVDADVDEGKSRLSRRRHALQGLESQDTDSDWRVCEATESFSSPSSSASSFSSSSSATARHRSSVALPSLAPWAAMAMGYTEYTPQQEHMYHVPKQDENGGRQLGAEWQELCAQDGSR